MIHNQQSKDTTSFPLKGTHITKIARPILRLGFRIPTHPQLDHDLEVLKAQNFLRPDFIDIFGLAVDEYGECGCSVGRDEGDVHFCGIDDGGCACG